MKRLFFVLILSVAVYLTLSAQSGARKGNFNFNEFPKVSFVWHDNNPSQIDETAFSLKEGDAKVDAKFKRIEHSIVNKKKRIVVLWEDMYSNGELMFSFSKQVLLQFVNNKDKEDEILIATFNRHHRTDKVLNPLTQQFVCDNAELSTVVKAYTHSSERFREAPKKADIFPALNESFEMINNTESEDCVYAVILITMGQPLEVTATNSIVSIQANALERHIPIYVLQYSPRHGPSTKFESLANDTYGMYFSCGNSKLNANVHQGVQAMSDFYAKMESRYAGQDYEISFSTKCKRGNKKQEITIIVDGVEYKDSFNSPEHTFGSWIEEYTVWFIIIIVAFIAVIVAAIIIPIRIKKKRREQEMENEEIKRQIEAQEQARQEEKLKQQRELIEKERSEKLQNLQRLIQLKHHNPTFKIEDSHQVYYYEMSNIEFTIGRSGCDLTINNGTVSSHHAIVRFTGNSFTIEDTNSTNGVIVDGTKADKIAVINNGSKIVLGNVTISFNF